MARRSLARASSFAPFCRPATVNGRAGFVVGPPGRILGVVGFRVAGGRITEVDAISDRASSAASRSAEVRATGQGS